MPLQLSPGPLIVFQASCKTLEARLATLPIDIENPLTVAEIAMFSRVLHITSVRVLEETTTLLVALASLQKQPMKSG